MNALETRPTVMLCLATFETTHMALMFENLCRKSGFQARVIPVPRNLSASCGLACRYSCDEEETVKKLAADHNVDVAGYYQLPE